MYKDGYGDVTIVLNELWKYDDYKDYGIKSCNWDSVGEFMLEFKDRLIEVWEERFAFREIGIETPEKWQFIINRRFNALKEKYNSLFRREKENPQYQVGSKIKTYGTEGQLREDESVPLPMEGADNYKDFRQYNKREYDSTLLNDPDNINAIDNMNARYKDLCVLFAEAFSDCFISTIGRLERS